MNQVPRHLFTNPPGKAYAEIPRKPKLNDTQCGFCRGSSTTEEISTLQQTFKKSWEHGKDVYTCFIAFGKVYARFPLKSFEGCCGSTVLTGAYCWPSSHRILVQKIVSLSTE